MSKTVARVALVVLCLSSLAVGLAGCAKKDAPAEAAVEFMQALSEQDGAALAKMVCEDQADEWYATAALSTAVGLISKEYLGAEVEYDLSELKAETVNYVNDDTAWVRVHGDMGMAIGLLGMPGEIDETWIMVHENRRWKWCGTTDATMSTHPGGSTTGGANSAGLPLSPAQSNGMATEPLPDLSLASQWEIVPVGISEEPDGDGWKVITIDLQSINVGEGWADLPTHFKREVLSVSTEQGFEYTSQYPDSGRPALSSFDGYISVPPGMQVAGVTGSDSYENVLAFRVPTASSGYVLHIPGLAPIDVAAALANPLPPQNLAWQSPESISVPGKGTVSITGLCRRPTGSGSADLIVMADITNANAGQDTRFEIKVILPTDDHWLIKTWNKITVGPGMTEQACWTLPVSRMEALAPNGYVPLLITGDATALVQMPLPDTGLPYAEIVNSPVPLVEPNPCYRSRWEGDACLSLDTRGGTLSPETEWNVVSQELPGDATQIGFGWYVTSFTRQELSALEGASQVSFTIDGQPVGMAPLRFVTLDEDAYANGEERWKLRYTGTIWHWPAGHHDIAVQFALREPMLNMNAGLYRNEFSLDVAGASPAAPRDQTTSQDPPTPAPPQAPDDPPTPVPPSPVTAVPPSPVTPEPLPQVMCTPPDCGPGVVPLCLQPDGCPGGCGVVCPTAASPATASGKTLVTWGPTRFGTEAGMCISYQDSLDRCGVFLPWALTQAEIENNVLPQMAKVPDGCRMELRSMNGKANQVIALISPYGKVLANVWIGVDPLSGWSVDGLVRVGTPWAPVSIWGVFERQSDGSYRRIQ